MRGSTALLPATYKFIKHYPIAGSWGTVATSTPRKSENNDFKEGGSVSNDQTEPTVAFSKPPPQPPLLGPLVALSLLETWSRREVMINDWFYEAITECPLCTEDSVANVSTT